MSERLGETNGAYTELLVHFSGGQTAVAQIEPQDLGFHDANDLESLNRAVRDYVEKALNSPARPHWAWIGDVYVFSQGVSGVSPLEAGLEAVQG